MLRLAHTAKTFGCRPSALLEVNCSAHALALDTAAAFHYQMTENKANEDAIEEARRKAQRR
jgi:hypothetical protein